MYRPLSEDGIVRKLIEAAGAAPSIHNTQPWRFCVIGDVIEVRGDPDRMLWVADALGRALHLSCGAALFNLRLAARALGAKPLVWPLPDPRNEPTLLASVQFEPARPPASEERELYEMIHLRHTSRAPFSERPVPPSVQIVLERAAGAEFAVLRMLNVGDAALVLELAVAADRCARRLSSGLAMGSQARTRPGAGWMTSSTARTPPPTRGPGDTHSPATPAGRDYGG